MDAFYASVEQRDHPELRGKAIAVGSPPPGRGVVMTASYEARKYGVRSAMPSSRAQNLCKHLIFVRPRFEAYKEASRLIRQVFRQYTDLIEPLSLDEAYLDVSQNKAGHKSAIYTAKEIKDKIKEETGLTASAGVSYCKFLAKMASDLHKPDGLSYISREEAADFLAQLPVRKFHGIGKVTSEKLNKIGIITGKDLRQRSEHELSRRFGKAGKFYYNIVRGIDNREVKPNRPIKSASVEDTFSEDTSDLATLQREIERLAEVLHGRLEKKDLWGKTFTLKIKYHDFQIITRSKTFTSALTSPESFADCGKELLRATEASSRPVRLIGIGVSNFENEETPSKGFQLELEFPEE